MTPEPEAVPARIEVRAPASVVLDVAACLQIEAIRDGDGHVVLATVEGGTLVRLIGDRDQAGDQTGVPIQGWS